jgi:alpha-amylase/alpha-mannosidase (GH57 family)
VCVHAHFYQPPRENPWLGRVESEPSAAPSHDWNERITDECYAPNAASRLLDDEGRITAIRNNYASISFNFGPTLLSWMERRGTSTYLAILEADRRSRERFEGHGSAIAQPFNHMILPLASARDRRTQVAWGIADFRHRFGRDPEGMWLPETAVDIASLEALAEAGITFTVLAPHQAARVRPADASAWPEASDGTLDTGVAYRQHLPSGRHIDLFFYHGPTSRAVAFENLLENGQTLAECLKDLTHRPEDAAARLGHIATDGETYGHHHAHGDMALAVAIDCLQSDPGVRIVNYGQFLARNPPQYEVEIREGTSWSCSHGVERWRSDCGCSTGGQPGSNQAWRAPLRRALDGLARDLADLYEREAGRLLPDPWAARDSYAAVLLDPVDDTRTAFVRAHAARPLAAAEERRVFGLLEMSRHAMLMYTSCGWFFDDLTRIETRQILRYAARAVELAALLGGASAREPFLTALAEARANGPDAPNGRDVLLKEAGRSRVAAADVAAERAALSTVGGPPVPAAEWSVQETRVTVSGPGSRSAAGRVSVTDARTGATERFRYRARARRDKGLDVRLAAVEPGEGTAAERSVSLTDLRADVRDVVAARCVDRFDAPDDGWRDMGSSLGLARSHPGEPFWGREALRHARRIAAALSRPRDVRLVAELEATLEAQTQVLVADHAGLEPEASCQTMLLLLDVADVLGVDLDLWTLQNRWWSALQGRKEGKDSSAARRVTVRLGFAAPDRDTA